MTRMQSIIAAIAAMILLTSGGGADEARYRVAFVGDSLTANILVAPKDLYPSLVNEILGDTIVVQNLGRPGATMTSDPDAVFKGWVDSRAAVLAISGWFPLAAVVVLLGTNDWMMGRSAESVEQAYRVFLSVVPSYMPVVCVTPPWRRDEDGAVNRAGATMDDVRQAIVRACTRRKAVIVHGENALPHEARFYLDPVHLTGAGYRQLARDVAGALKGVL